MWPIRGPVARSSAHFRHTKESYCKIGFCYHPGQMRLGPRQSAFSLACLLIVTFWLCGNIAAQQKPGPKASTQAKRQPTAAPSREPELRLERLPEDPAVEAADIAITARVKARELKFEVVPNTSVEFPGQPARETAWEAERENLPTPVEPGVTYRNIGIRLKITSVFSDIDRIVAEALGEIPITDDAKQSGTEATRTPSVVPKALSPRSQSATSRHRGERQ